MERHPYKEPLIIEKTAMSQRQIVVIIGVWVMIFLFIGLPSVLEKALAILTGLLIIIYAYRLKLAGSAPKADTFSDSTPAVRPPVSTSEVTGVDRSSDLSTPPTH